MATITFSNGKSANFNGTPTPADIDYVAKQIGVTPDVKTPATATPSAQPKSFGSQIAGAAAGAVNFINNNPISKAITSIAALPVQLGAKAFGAPDPFANGIGAQTGPLKPAAVTTYQGKTAGQYAGEEAGNALQVASLAFPYGKVAEGVGSLAEPLLGKTLAGFGSKVASGALGGYGVDVANNLQTGAPQPLQPGAGTAIGAAIPVVGPAVGAAARGVGESLGVSTGTGYGVIKEAFNAASAGGKQAQDFTDALRGKIAPEQIVDDAKASLGKIVNNRAQGYQTLLKSIKGSSAQLDVAPIKTELQSQLEKFQIKPGAKGVLNFQNSTIADKAEQSKVQNIYNDVQRWASGKADNSPLGIDTLKRRIGGYFSPNSDVRALVTGVKNSAKKVLSTTEGYTPAMKAYADASDTIEDIQKGLSLTDKASVDTSFRKLTTALRTNNEFRKELIGELDKASGGYLSSKIAGQQLSEALPRGIIRQFEGFGAAGLLLSGGGIIPLLQVAAVSSPRSVGEIVNALGISKRVFNGLLDHLAANSADAAQTAGRVGTALSQQPQPLNQGN